MNPVGVTLWWWIRFENILSKNVSIILLDKTSCLLHSITRGFAGYQNAAPLGLCPPINSMLLCVPKNTCYEKQDMKIR